MQGLEYFITAVIDFTLDPMTLFHVAWATLLGITVGALPGLTATLGIALLTTLTFRMESSTAILILVAVWETRSFARGPGHQGAQPQSH